MKTLKIILFLAAITVSITTNSQTKVNMQTEEETVFWDQFKTEFTKLVNSTDIAEFKGDNETNSWGQTYYDCKLEPLGVVEKIEFTYIEPEDFIPYVRVNFNMGELRDFWGTKRTPDQVEEDINKIESIFDNITKSRLVKVYCADESVNIMAGEPYLASKSRTTINDNIYYIMPEEINKDLGELAQMHLEVDIESTSNGVVKVSITVKQ